MQDPIRLTIEGGVATIVIDRAPTNAMNHAMLAALLGHFRSLATDEDVNVIVLTGSGYAFSVRPDLQAAETRQFEAISYGLPLDTSRHLIHAFLDIPQPVIVAMNGDASLVGATLALLADFLVIAQDAQLLDSHVSLGLVAGDGGVTALPLMVGINRAKHLLMLSRPITAQEALDLGIAYSAVPREQVLPAAKTLAADLNSRNPRALQWTKHLLNRHLKQSNDLVGELALSLEHLTLISRGRG